MDIAFYGDSLTKGIPGVSYVDIARQALPGHRLFNYGKGGDTVISLRERIVRRGLAHPVDVAVVWVGVNDVFVHLNRFSPALKTMQGQPWVADAAAFEKEYHVLLDLLARQARHVVTASPALLGEEVDNQWNKRLAELAVIVKRASAAYNDVRYVDMHRLFVQELQEKQVSPYEPIELTRIGADVIFLRNDSEVDAMAAQRGLHLTLDGCHLNSAGAQLAADTFVDTIKALQPELP